MNEWEVQLYSKMKIMSSRWSRCFEGMCCLFFRHRVQSFWKIETQEGGNEFSIEYRSFFCPARAVKRMISAHEVAAKSYFDRTTSNVEVHSGVDTDVNDGYWDAILPN